MRPRLLALACGLCGLGGGAAALDGPVALVQQTVLLHSAPEHKAKRQEPLQKYLVHKGSAPLKGPGVLYRTQRDFSSAPEGGEYAAWESTVEGTFAGGPWIKVGERFLPATVGGVRVLVPLEETRARMKETFEPTEVRKPDGSWAPCNITGVGSKPDTYNVLVAPPTDVNSTSGKRQTHYPMANVPAVLLKQVSVVKVRGLVPESDLSVKRPPAWSTEGYLKLKVEESIDQFHTISVMRKSPTQVLKRLACGQVQISPKACDDTVHLVVKGRQVQPDEKVWELGLRDGDAVQMRVTKVKA